MNDEQFQKYLMNLLDRAAKHKIAMVCGYTKQNGEIVVCSSNLDNPPRSGAANLQHLQEGGRELKRYCGALTARNCRAEHS